MRVCVISSLVFLEVLLHHTAKLCENGDVTVTFVVKNWDVAVTAANINRKTLKMQRN